MGTFSTHGHVYEPNFVKLDTTAQPHMTTGDRFIAGCHGNCLATTIATGTFSAHGHVYEPNFVKLDTTAQPSYPATPGTPASMS